MDKRKQTEIAATGQDEMDSLHGGAVACALSAALTLLLLLCIFLGGTAASESTENSTFSKDKLVTLDSMIDKISGEAYESLQAVPKHFWLDDKNAVAPEPNPNCYGESDDPGALGWLLEDAATLLDGQETLFSTETEILANSKVTYYLDETTLAITWKQPIDGIVYSISEVKIADASQFRRYLADNTYGSRNLQLPSKMAADVNAVVASVGDFYTYRAEGLVVYNGVVERLNDEKMDTCFVDANGDLSFSYRSSFKTKAEAQKYVDENKIRFSISFGPVLVDHNECVVPRYYIVGEINDHYTRSALGQMDQLHYLFVVVHGEEGHLSYIDVRTLAEKMKDFGCEMAYNMDGGRSATLVMNDKIMSRHNYGPEKELSDIVYFATAVP